MILSRRHQFALLTPWKTASSTAHLRLERYNESPYSRFYDYNPYLQRVVHQHITYAEFAMLPESREGYFTGAFVRNPYDKVYSGFLQLQRDIEQQPSAVFPSAWIKALVMRQLADNFAQLAVSEFDFNKWFGLVEEYQIYEIGLNSCFPLHPAHYWTGINREQKIDFVGKVECFEHDFDAFCQKVGVAPPDERATANVSDKLSASESLAYPRYIKLMSAATISKINEVFSADFELFEYEKH
jgi:Sulfotransferase family